jgi:hypothetical protein
LYKAVTKRNPTDAASLQISIASSVDNGGSPSAECTDKVINKAVSMMRMSLGYGATLENRGTKIINPANTHKMPAIANAGT